MEAHFVNLTDGIEWLPTLPPGVMFCRIESTAIEKRDWDRVLRGLDSNLLLRLALGHTCHVYDCGTNRPTSKTISKGLPFIRKTLTDLWNGKSFRAETPERKALKRHLLYFRRYFTGTVKLIGHSFSTTRDGDREFYRDSLIKFFGELP